MKLNHFFGLTGNQCKILALVAMTIDHIGVQIFPQNPVLHIIGRLAFPIFAYMIAEGAKYTKNRKKYLGTMLALGICFQIVYFFTEHSLYQSIFITFSLSILLIYALDHALKRKTFDAWILLVLLFLVIFFVAYIVPELLVDRDFYIDYGIWGILLPVFVYLGKNKWEKLALCVIPLFFLSLMFIDQKYAFFALIPLALYNGKRGKLNMKYLFYIYYPLHLIIIYLYSLLL